MDRASFREAVSRTAQLWIAYYPETDSLYIELSKEPGVETKEVSDGVNVDIDARGNLVGFDIDRAANRLDLSSLETTALPLRSYKIG